MKNLSLLLLMFFLSACQTNLPGTATLPYEPNEQYPFGRANPDAPPELAQFHFMVGRNDCSEQRLNNATGDWDDGSRSWDGHYFMNGFAIRDGGKSGAVTNGNIRVYDPALGEWVVTFFSAPAYSSSIWRGKMEGESLVLRRPQKALGTDLDGFSTLTFSDVSAQGFDWVAAWMSVDGSLVFPFWRVQCQKVATS